MRRMALAFLLLTLVLGSGCATYKEELQLHKDGSGTLSFISGVVDLFGTEGEVKYDPGGIDGYRIVSVNSYTDEEFAWTEAVAEFDSIDVLAKVAQTSEGFVGCFSYEKDAEGNMLFTRDLSPIRDLIRVFAGEDELSGEMIEEELGELALLPWNYAVQFAGQVLDSNALPENIDETTNTVRWSLTFRDLVEAPQILWATIAP